MNGGLGHHGSREGVMMMNDAEIAHLELDDAELAGVFGGMAEAACADEVAPEESVMM